MRKLSVFVMIAAAVLLAAGCPKGDKPAPADGSATSNMAPGGGTTTAATGENTASESPAAPSAGDTSTPATPNDGAATPAPAAETAAAVEPSLLAGEWFALFGRQDEGIIEDAWKTNHRVRFDKQGNVVFTLGISGNPEEVQGKYTASGGVAKVTLAGAKSVKSGLSHLAPLGIGRNEEVGLLKQAGRNEEIGLDKKSDIADAAGNITRDVKYAVYGSFLVLSDSYDHLLIYGKAPAKQDPSTPDLAGAWTASIGANTGLDTTCAWDGKQLTFNLGSQGKFTGTLVHGFIVGSLQRTPGLSLVALFPQTNNQLKGVYLPDPYLEFKTDLELFRAK